MDDKEDSLIHTDADELDTTAPSPASEEWRMPEPVFRRSSGRLAGGVEDEAAEVFAHGQESTEYGNPSPALQLSEPQPRSGVLKIVVVALAIGAMIAFIIVFLTVVYFFFFYRTETPI